MISQELNYADSRRPNLRSSSSLPSWPTHPDNSFDTSLEWKMWTDEDMTQHSTRNPSPFPSRSDETIDPFAVRAVPEREQIYHNELMAGAGGPADHLEKAFGFTQDVHASLSGPTRTRSLRKSRSSKSYQTSPSHSQLHPASTSSSPKPRSSIRIPVPVGTPDGSSSSHSLFQTTSTSIFTNTRFVEKDSLDPALSVSDSGPPSTSSFSRISPSQVGSSSTSSSLHGEPNSQNTPTAVGKSKSSRRISTLGKKSKTETKKSASPKKTKSVKRLTPLERKKICQHCQAFPSMSQSDVGLKFDIERSTVSKITKYHKRWLAVGSDGEEGPVEEELDDDNDSDLEEYFIPPPPSSLPHATAPSVSPPPPSSSKTPSSTSVVPAPFYNSPTSFISSALSSISIRPGGRYRELDRRLFDWARSQVDSGQVLSDEVLRKQALDFAPSIPGCLHFKGSITWLEKFKERASITSGTFLELMSLEDQRLSRRMIKTEVEEVEEEAEDDVKEDDERDADFVVEKTAVRKSRRQSKMGLAISSASDFGSMFQAVGGPIAGPVDNTLIRLSPDYAGEITRDSESTPTGFYSNTQLNLPSSTTWDSFTGRNFDSVPSTYPMSNQSSSSSRLLTDEYLGHLDEEQAQDSSPDLTFLQPPFQSTHQSTYARYQGTAPSSSGPLPPGGRFRTRHARSESTASTTSSFSALTAFSAQSGNGTPQTGSLHSSFSGHQSNMGSLPSTPSTGYFGYGVSKNQSQLQAAFLDGQQSPPRPSSSAAHFTKSLAQLPTRRATIGHGFAASPHSTRVTRQSVSNEQAYAALQTALEYASSQGQGYVTPGDLVLLCDLMAKVEAQAAAASAVVDTSASRPATASTTTTTNKSSTPRLERLETPLLGTHTLSQPLETFFDGARLGMGTRRSSGINGFQLKDDNH